MHGTLKQQRVPPPWLVPPTKHGFNDRHQPVPTQLEPSIGPSIGHGRRLHLHLWLRLTCPFNTTAQDRTKRERQVMHHEPWHLLLPITSYNECGRPIFPAEFICAEKFHANGPTQDHPTTRPKLSSPQDLCPRTQTLQTSPLHWAEQIAWHRPLLQVD